MTMKIDFRGSEVTDYLRCRKRYEYAWIQNLEPKQRNEKLTIGSAIHKFLELWYSEHRALEAIDAMVQYIYDNTRDMDQTEADDLCELARNICVNYVQYYGMDHNWTVKGVELPFSVQLNSEINYIGTIDLLVEDEDGKLWIVDHKTTASIDIYDKNSDMDRQISRYWASLEKLGYRIEGFIYNIILKDIPVEPKLLKTGALSKDKSQKTTLAMYREAIERNNLKEEDYADFLQYLEDQPKEFFRRVKVERTEAERMAALDETEQIIDDIRTTHPKRFYRNITKDCSWDCSFKALCVAQMDGSNAYHIQSELYKVKDDAE
jgi:RecB family exonuclease